MPHVREGELHAYLDGALDRLGEETARRVREHVSSCEDCQALMEQERALRESAAALLDRALPREITPPPFEELRRRALVGESASPGARPEVAAAAKPTAPPVPGSHRPRTGFSTWKWAWAASLVMALGTGWMIGGGSLDFRDAPRLPIEEAASEAEVSPPAPEQAPLMSADEAAPAPEPVAEVEQDRVSPARVGTATRREAPARVPADRDVAVDANDEAAPIGLARVRTGVASDLAAASGARLDSAPPASLPTPAAAAAFEDAPVELLESVASTAPVAADGGPMVFEAAPVMSVLPIPQAGGRAVLQELPTGDSVLLVWVGESVESERFGEWLDGATPLAEGTNFRARRAPMRQLQPSEAPAVELRQANEAFALGRAEPWPTSVRISRGADLLTVFSTVPEPALREALVQAGLMPGG